MLPRNRQATISKEKQFAEGFKQGATRDRRQKCFLRSALVHHRTRGVAPLCSAKGAGSSRKLARDALEKKDSPGSHCPSVKPRLYTDRTAAV